MWLSGAFADEPGIRLLRKSSGFAGWADARTA
jgi:hypothetical protein